MRSSRLPSPLLAALLLLAAPIAARAESAFELWERVREAHAGAEAYGDRGTLELTDPRGRLRTLRFTTALAPGGRFRFDLAEGDGPQARRQALWRDVGRTLVSADGGATWSRVASAVGALSRMAGVEPALGLDALLAPALLLTGGASPAPPAAASLGGPVPCPGTRPCQLLALAWPDSGVEADLWVEEGTARLRGWEVRAPEGPPGALAGRWVARARVEEAAAGAAAAAILAGLEEPPPGAGTTTPDEPPAAVFGERVEVGLASVVVRVVGPGSAPIHGLGASDFRVRVGGREVPVRHVDERAAPAAGAPEDRLGLPPPAALPLDASPPLLVLFVQADMEPSRIRGHLRLLRDLEALLHALPRDVPVAVASFDSHLKLWLDFSLDREGAADAVADAVRFGAEPPPFPRRARRRDPSLATRLDFDEAMRVASNARALETVATALTPLTGEKSILYLGFGIGRLSLTGGPGPAYDEAVRALHLASARLFVYDVTDADYHTLEHALQHTAMVTGGTYLRGRHASKAALARMAAVAASYYRLHVDVADLPPRPGEVRVTLADGGGEVLVSDGATLARP